MNTNPAGYTYPDYLAHQDDELYHFGIKGMKWGVRRFLDRARVGASAALRDRKASRSGAIQRSKRAIDNGEGLIGKAIYNSKQRKRIQKAINQGIDKYYDKDYDTYWNSRPVKKAIRKFSAKNDRKLLKEAVKTEQNRRRYLRDNTYDITSEDYKFSDGGYFGTNNYNRLRKKKGEKKLQLQEYRRALRSDDSEVRALARQELKKKGLY